MNTEAKKENTWVDYTNLALNVAQTAQIVEARNQLAQLQIMQLDEQARQNAEKQLRQVEDQLRQAIFEMEELLERVVNLKERPITVSLVCKINKKWLKACKVTPAAFREFADKDRVKNIIEKLDAVFKDNWEKLDDAQRREVDECLRFIRERNDLVKLIKLEKKAQKTVPDLPVPDEKKFETLQTELRKTEATLKPMRVIADSMLPKQIIGGIIAFGSMILSIFVLADDKVAFPHGVILAMLFFIVVPISVSVFLVAQFKNECGKIKNQYPEFDSAIGGVPTGLRGFSAYHAMEGFYTKLKEVQKEYDILKENFKNINSEMCWYKNSVEEHKKELWALQDQVGINQFGNLNSAGYKKMLNDRDKRIKNALTY